MVHILYLLVSVSILIINIPFYNLQKGTSHTGEKLVWSDEFDGQSLDLTKWVEETGAHGWGNNELQNYIANKSTIVSNGTLKIIVQKTGDGQNRGDYTSARLNSTEFFTYGRMEIRAKLPKSKGNGLWPAIWMLGKNIGEVGWPACGEIDIMEYVSYAPNQINFAVHSDAYNHVKKTQLSSGPVSLESAEELFHNYGAVWTNTGIDFYLDEPTNVMYRVKRPKDFNNKNWPFSKPHYFLINMAVGGNWGGKMGINDAIFPAIFEIDYVRVYQ